MESSLLEADLLDYSLKVHTHHSPFANLTRQRTQVKWKCCSIHTAIPSSSFVKVISLANVFSSEIAFFIAIPVPAHCISSSLRHTFATRAIENGMDILVLSRILGHAKPSTTLNMYGHVLTEHRTESMQKISSLYNPTQTSKSTEQTTMQEDQKNIGPILQF